MISFHPGFRGIFSVRKGILVFLVVAFSIFIYPQPEAKAIDPVTIAILTPVAIKVAQVASPYIIRGLINAGKGFLLAGKEMFRIFLLPLGFCEVTFGAPFGFFGEGLKDLIKGGIAPFKMTFYIITIPIRIFGVAID